jgi:uncharacterized repeat protein (TIGR03803 family)
MPSKKLSIGMSVVLGMFAATLLGAGTRAAAQQEQLLYSFNDNGKDGTDPAAGVIMDSAGNLYGTTVSGGVHGQGTVFELTPTVGGQWEEKPLYAFKGGAKDGSTPTGGLIFDSAGNLYGTTQVGGEGRGGTVFELSPVSGGQWTETILHSFTYNHGADGIYPYAGLVFDAAGNLYGTTLNGGGGYCTDSEGYRDGCGTVFELSPAAGGGWSETILHEFGKAKDGANPAGGLIVDAAGNLYGTTLYGGINSNGINSSGTAFELLPSGGSWVETVLHNFNSSSSDGSSPAAGLIFDAAGNLYGTTSVGGAQGGGIVFELTPTPGNAWTESILTSFGDGVEYASKGYRPSSSVIFDAAGNLYGTTYSGGVYGWGTAFALKHGLGGSWSHIVLHSFDFNPDGGTDGGDPSGMIFSPAGNLFGTTYLGGTNANQSGTVFEIKP